jgi:hypothetical protein
MTVRVNSRYAPKSGDEDASLRRAARKVRLLHVEVMR